MLSDPRFQNGNQPQGNEPPKNGAWRRLGDGAIHALRTTTWIGISVAAMGTVAVIVAEASLPPDHRLRPANLFAGLHGDYEAGVLDRVQAVAVKWGVLEQEALARIQRKTETTSRELEVRVLDFQARVGAADEYQNPSWVMNYTLVGTCSILTVTRGADPSCQQAKDFRRDLMNERTELIGEVKLLYSDAELMADIGLAKDFMDQFENAE